MNQYRSYIGCVLFVPEMSIDNRLKNHLRERQTAFPYVSKVVISNWHWPYYKKIPNFDTTTRLDVCSLKEGTMDELNLKLSELMSIPMNPNEPLYKWHIIRNFKGGAVLLHRIHHCIVDGMASIQLFYQMTTLCDVQKNSDSEKSLKRDKKLYFKKPNMLQKSWYLVKAVLKILTQSADDKLQFLAHTGGIPTPTSMCYTCINEYGIPVESVKKVAYKFGVTINDVITSVIAGGLREYLIKNGNKFDLKMLKMGKEYLKTVTWVNTRSKSFKQLIDECYEKGDKYRMKEDDYCVNFGSIFHIVPVHIADNLERLKFCNKELRRLLHSAEPCVTSFVLSAMGFTPPIFALKIWNAIAFKSSLSISNVRGPPEQRLFAKRMLDDVIFITQPKGTISEMITVFSYNSTFRFCFNGMKDYKTVKGMMNSVLKCLDDHIKLCESD